MYHILLCLIIYVVCLIAFSNYWKKVNLTDEQRSYSFCGDLKMFEDDNKLFRKEIKNNKLCFSTDLEKCEWSLEKMKDIFQLFSVADVTLWPYQLFVSFLASIIILLHLKMPLQLCTLLTTSFILFVLMDLPRRFLSFHRNALLSNKGLNIFNYYYKELKYKNLNCDIASL